MKKEKRIPLIIMMVIAVLASIAALGYALTFKNNVPVQEQSSAMAFWNIAYWIAVVLIVCAAIGIVVFLIKQIIEEKQKGIIIIFAATVVALIVSYLISSGTDIAQSVFEKTGTDYGSSKMIGAGLYTVYILFAGVILSVLYAEIAKRLK
jgi:uncharacterized membrane protein